MRLLFRVLTLIIVLLGTGPGRGSVLRRQPEIALLHARASRCITWISGREQERQTYYFTPQGTQVKGLRYEWFQALELPFSEQRFAAPDYLARFGFLIDPQQTATPNNPGNLPVGFARHQNPGSTEQYLDITCAACHTGELRFKGQAVRIDGGTAQHVLPSSVPTLRGGSFGQALVASLTSTYYNPWKFERFARTRTGR